ncbi:MAG: hypothetical protein VYE47_06915 [Pseudomonadota bacterium]|nr:hypothetical protein [Pseudomonadota bacterium]
MLKAAAVALALSTTAPVTVEEGAKPVEKQQEATTQFQKMKPCTHLNACDLN